MDRRVPIQLPCLFLLLCSLAHAGAGRINSDGSMDFEVNFRYPPTTAQIEAAKTAIRDAARIICDATDGQVRFRNVRLTGGAAGGDGGDVWILPQDGRSGVSFSSNGSSLGTAGAHITLFQGGINGRVIAHELGHLAFGLGDEYDEQRRFGGARHRAGVRRPYGCPERLHHAGRRNHGTDRGGQPRSAPG